MKRFTLLILLALLATGHGLLVTSATAQAPSLINYQGRLLDGTNLVSALVAIRLRIYDAPTGGTLLYEDFGEPDVVDGLYSTFLGDGTTTGSLQTALASTNAYLEVVANNQVLSPRERIGAAAYAAHAWGLSGNANTTTGMHFIGTTDSEPLDLRAGNVRALRLAPTFNGEPNIIGGIEGNAISASAVGSTISGGGQNGGGGVNTIDGDYSVVAGGSGNRIRFSSDYSAIGGGVQNVINSNANGSVIGGGENNDIGLSADYAVVPGGRNNEANADDTFAAGRNAKANHGGSFVWADGQSANFGTSSSNQFLIRASGGVGIGVTSPVSALHVRLDDSGNDFAPNVNSIAVFERSSSGFLNILTPTNTQRGVLFGDESAAAHGGIVYNSGNANGLQFRTGGNITRMTISSNGFVGIATTAPTSTLHVAGTITCTTLNETSDRNAKENFAPVDPAAILDRVAGLPVQYWNYNGQEHRHIGPTAQDFHEAFKVGENDVTISGVDRDGVSLAAIQALYQLVQQQQRRIEELERALQRQSAPADP